MVPGLIDLLSQAKTRVTNGWQKILRRIVFAKTVQKQKHANLPIHESSAKINFEHIDASKMKTQAARAKEEDQ